MQLDKCPALRGGGAGRNAGQGSRRSGLRRHGAAGTWHQQRRRGWKVRCRGPGQARLAPMLLRLVGRHKDDAN
jgi:hypothetical protein